ncbi:MAG: DUF2232 domain-containing protein [Clostridia bacterium]|nr:DUF2232 domain-containing protein [Clostridia bacterium]
MRRGLKTYTTLRAAQIACALWVGAVALAFALSDAPAVLLSAAVLAAGPAALMIIGTVAGSIPMGVCAAVTLGGCLLAGPGALALCAAVYLLPALAVFAWCMDKNTPFWRSCGMTAGALLASQLIIFLWLQSRTAGQLAVAVGSLAARYINGLPYRDQLLYTLAASSFLQVPSAMQEGALLPVPGGYTLSDELINELLLQVRGYTGVLIESLVPNLFISGSGLNALLGLSLGIRYGRRTAANRAFRLDEDVQPIPDLAMPALRDWHLPRPWGLRVGVLGVGYFLARYAQNSALSMLGLLMFQVFMLCYGVQGLAAMNASQHRRGTSRGWRCAVVVMALLLRFMQIALIAVGVIDQITNARGLRPPMWPRGEEEE